jgi:hypothetical protein
MINLNYPVTHNGQTYESLTLRRSKIKDRLAVSKMTCSDEEKEIRLFANLCEVPPEVLMELDESDYKKLQTEYMSFFK